MPLVTATPRGNRNGQVLTEFIDSVGTTGVTYSYPTTQEMITIRNTGEKPITITIGGTSQTIQPGNKWDNVADFSSFDIVSTSGVQSFEARTDEKGSTFDTPEGQYFSSVASMANLLGDKLYTPSGFSWANPPIQIYKNTLNQYIPIFDVANYQITGKTYYVDPVNGNDANDGLSQSSALLRLKTATSKADVDVVIISAGTVYRNDLPATINRTMSIKAALGASVILSAHDQLAWTQTAGKTITWQAARSTVARVYDTKFIDSYGDYQQLTQQVSIDAVDLNPGSWYSDGTTTYVSLSDSRQATNSFVRVYLSVSFITAVNKTLYLEGLRLEGGRLVDVTNATGFNFYAKNCTFKYGVTSNGGLAIKGCDYAFVQNCLSARNELDGFNYHINGGLNPKVIEVNCIGRHNGTSGDNDNGSTIHDGGTIIRVNGEYYGNVGPNVADVNTGTSSWNLGCTAYDSHAASVSVKSNFTVSTGSAKMWLDGCTSKDSNYALRVGDALATAYVRNVRFTGLEEVLGSKQVY